MGLGWCPPLDFEPAGAGLDPQEIHQKPRSPEVTAMIYRTRSFIHILARPPP